MSYDRVAWEISLTTETMRLITLVRYFHCDMRISAREVHSNARYYRIALSSEVIKSNLSPYLTLLKGGEAHIKCRIYSMSIMCSPLPTASVTKEWILEEVLTSLQPRFCTTDDLRNLRCKFLRYAYPVRTISLGEVSLARLLAALHGWTSRV